MPDLAGRLYPSEKAALRREKEAEAAREAKAKAAVVAAQKAVVAKAPKPKHPLHPDVFGPKQAGRPARAKATPELVNAICADIRKGLPIDSAFIRAGISRQAIDVWRKANPAVDLMLEKAEADWETVQIARLDLAGERESKVVQWMLERRLPQKWAPVAKTELTGKDGGPILAMSIHKSLLSSVGQGIDPLSKAKRAEPASAAAA